MRRNRSTDIASLLGTPGSRLARLAREASERATLAGELRRHLDPELAAHVVQAAIEPGGLAVVAVDSAAWANRIRYQQASLIEGLRALGYEVRALKVRIAPPGGR